MIPFFLIAHPSQPASLKEADREGEGASRARCPTATAATARPCTSRASCSTCWPASKLQAVPYKGSGPVSADVLGGQVPLGVVDVPSAIANVRAGKMRALAVTSKRRIAAAPEVPTFEEAGVPGYEAIGWFGVVAPAGTPAPIIERLNAEIALGARRCPRSASARSTPAPSPLPTRPQEFAALIREETKKWAEVIKAGRNQAPMTTAPRSSTSTPTC